MEEGGAEVQLQHFSLLRYMEANGQLHAFAHLPPREKPFVPIGWKVGRPQSVSRSCGEKKAPCIARNQTRADEASTEICTKIIGSKDKVK
jgi:hypothetical protein